MLRQKASQLVYYSLICMRTICINEKRARNTTCWLNKEARITTKNSIQGAQLNRKKDSKMALILVFWLLDPNFTGSNVNTTLLLPISTACSVWLKSIRRIWFLCWETLVEIIHYLLNIHQTKPRGKRIIKN
jgi:hypothetical protein